MAKNPKIRPIGVLLADMHFTPATLELASDSFRQAAQEAKRLGVPLILAGDTTDSKAIIRAEVANRLIELMTWANQLGVTVYVIVGNHDRINEKSSEHALNFLVGWASCVVDTPLHEEGIGWLIPYQSDVNVFKAILDTIPKGSLIIAHQGVQNANMGHYVQDRTAIPQEWAADYRIISGHYHARQDIKCGRPQKGAVGLFSYIGNPYTLTFGEANDPEKGFQVLMSDGLLEFHPTDLRKHWIWEWRLDQLNTVMARGVIFGPNKEDLVWLKVTGPKSELAKLRKKDIGERLLGHSNFKLDLIPSDSEELEPESKPLQDTEILDNLIQALPDSEEHKKYLKQLWREILE